jgi:hypothetical protein
MSTEAHRFTRLQADRARGGGARRNQRSVIETTFSPPDGTPPVGPRVRWSMA